MTQHKSRCAVCGNDIENVVRHSHGDEEYHFCSEECRLEFINHPYDYEKVWEYFRKQGFDKNAIKCAVCGSTVSEEVAVKQEHSEDVSNEKYFFCCDKHRMDFLANPSDYEDQSGKHIT